jgi:hypothetical protein
MDAARDDVSAKELAAFERTSTCWPGSFTMTARVGHSSADLEKPADDDTACDAACTLTGRSSKTAGRSLPPFSGGRLLSVHRRDSAPNSAQRQPGGQRPRVPGCRVRPDDRAAAVSELGRTTPRRLGRARRPRRALECRAAAQHPFMNGGRAVAVLKVREKDCAAPRPSTFRLCQHDQCSRGPPPLARARGPSLRARDISPVPRAGRRRSSVF